MSYIGTKPANQITDSTLIADGTVTTADLANGAVTAAKIADATITASKIASGQILPANGIAFPATQSASTDANTLDDYEEGTWTPTFTNFSGTIVGDARYTKIGRLVTISFRVNWTSASGGAISVSLPFTAGFFGSGSSGGCGTVFWQGPNAGTFGPIAVHVPGGAVSFTFYKLASVNFTQVDSSNVNGSYDLLATFFYFV